MVGPRHQDSLDCDSFNSKGPFASMSPAMAQTEPSTGATVALYCGKRLLAMGGQGRKKVWTGE